MEREKIVCKQSLHLHSAEPFTPEQGQSHPDPAHSLCPYKKRAQYSAISASVERFPQHIPAYGGTGYR